MVAVETRLVSLSFPEPNTGCWLFAGVIQAGTGYGLIRISGRPRMAHRISYEVNIGAIPNGLTLDHLCRNRACVNPGHLEPVTAGVNVLRGIGPSAANARKKTCNQGHAFDEDNTSIMRRPDGRTYRRCNACHRAHQAPINARRSRSSSW